MVLRHEQAYEWVETRRGGRLVRRAGTRVGVGGSLFADGADGAILVADNGAVDLFAGGRRLELPPHHGWQVVGWMPDRRGLLVSELEGASRIGILAIDGKIATVGHHRAGVELYNAVWPD